MNFQLKSMLLVGAAVVGFVFPASAVPMKAVWQGTVTNSSDVTNTFGTGGGSSLDGQHYTFTMIFDPETTGAIRFTDATADRVMGGTSLDTQSPVQLSTLQIGGHSETWISNYEGDVLITNSYYTNYLTFLRERVVGIVTVGGINYADEVRQDTFDNLSVVSPSLDSPYVSGSFLYYSGLFRIQHFDFALGRYTAFVIGDLIPTSVTISRFSQVSAVPLPAALPLLATGIGAIGFAGRRRRKTKVAVSS